MPVNSAAISKVHGHGNPAVKDIFPLLVSQPFLTRVGANSFFECFDLFLKILRGNFAGLILRGQTLNFAGSDPSKGGEFEI